MTFALSEADPYRPKLLPTDGTNIYDPSSLFGCEDSAAQLQTTELDFEGTASLAKAFSVGSHYSTFEMGFEGRDAHKSKTKTIRSSTRTAVSPFTMGQVFSTHTNPNYYDGYFGG